MFFFRNRVTLPTDTPSSPALETNENDTPVFFLPSLYRYSDFFSGPEHTYEDEAWAPEAPQIRLFNKRQSIAEE